MEQLLGLRSDMPRIVELKHLCVPKIAKGLGHMLMIHAMGRRRQMLVGQVHKELVFGL